DIENRFGDILIQVSDNIGGIPDIKFGFGKILKLTLPAGGVFAGLTILAGMAPLIALPIALVAIVFSLIINKDGVNEKIKREVGRVYKEQISLKLRDLADLVAEAVDEQCAAFQQKLDSALEREIQNFREHLQNALIAQREGKTEQRLNELERCRDELN